jgi:hypothetical protein
MRTLLLMFALVACSSDDKKPATDAAPPISDSPVAATPTCTAYCADIQAHCTAANAQYPTADQCMATCTTFTVGTGADTSGNTLGCRAYHAGAPAMTAPDTHCPHAGPGGDLVTAAAPGTCGDACTSFCNLEIKVCGSLDAPLTGITARYQNAAACMTACGNFAKTTPYSTASSAGNTLACRLFHATNAALYSAMGNTATASNHCGHTAETATGQCI